MLGKTVMESEKNDQNILDFAGSGFESTVRLAKSSPEMWSSIFKDNRKNILEMAVSAGADSAHFGGALSIAEIISTLFAYQMRLDKKNPNWDERDRFILSKGHACLAYYAALCEIGYISKVLLWAGRFPARWYFLLLPIPPVVDTRAGIF